MAQEDVPTLEAWLHRAHTLGLTAAAVRCVDEVRAVGHDGGVTVGPVQRVTVLGYQAGTLVVLRDVPDSADAIVHTLEEAGFTVRRTTDSLG